MELLEEILNKWDRGGLLNFAKLGGLGPGYEQAICIATMEIIRYVVMNQTQPEEMPFMTIDRVDYGELGLSGAQVHAAEHQAFTIIRDGYDQYVRTIKKADRDMMFSKHWPLLGDDRDKIVSDDS